jgi:hypothetical protein
MTSLCDEAFRFMKVPLCLAARAAMRGALVRSWSRAMKARHHSGVSWPHGS